METAFGFGEHIQLEENHVVARRVLCRQSKYTCERPCVRIFQNRDDTRNNVTIILWDPTEFFHTKVYQITEDGIIEQRNPTTRSWHEGDVATYQSG